MEQRQTSKQAFLTVATKILRRIERAQPEEAWWHEVRELTHDLNFIRLGLCHRQELNCNSKRPVLYVSDVWRNAGEEPRSYHQADLFYGVREWLATFPWITHSTIVTFSGCDPNNSGWSIFAPIDVTFDQDAYAAAPQELQELYAADYPFPMGIKDNAKVLAILRRNVVRDLSNWIDAVGLMAEEIPQEPQAETPAAEEQPEFFYGDIAKTLKCDPQTVRQRAIDCGLTVPDRGKKSLRYTQSQFLALLECLALTLRSGDQRAAAQQWAAELKTKDRK